MKITRADGLVTRAEAAELAGVKAITVTQWMLRGVRFPDGTWRHLTEAKREGRLILLDPVDVAKFEHATAPRARRIIEPAAA